MSRQSNEKQANLLMKTSNFIPFLSITLAKPRDLRLIWSLKTSPYSVQNTKVSESLLEGQELTAKWDKLKNTNISDNESYKKGYIFMIYMVIFFSKYNDKKKWM